MKSTVTLLSLLIIVTSLFAQTPEKMTYQAVVFNSANEVVVNQEIGMKISILQGSSEGSSVYTERHTPTTNTNGLVTIYIGDGMSNDDFSIINWSAGPFFIKSETDPTGGADYSLSGISQLLSVPYALHAKTAETANNYISRSQGIPVYTSEEIAALSPTVGNTVFNSTENISLLFNGSSWQETITNCWPNPTQALAGVDHQYDDATTSITLSANTPEVGHGDGKWSVIYGEGGSFVDDTSPNTIFNGQSCTSYGLQWSISTSCNISYDYIFVSFSQMPTKASAGQNIYYTNSSDTVVLEANAPEENHGIGEWSIIDGEGGEFGNINDPKTTFIPNSTNPHTLQWSITSDCQTSLDTIMIIMSNVSLTGSDYYVIEMDDLTFSNNEDKIIQDLRPDNEDKFLYVWDNSFILATRSGLNFYGSSEEWIALQVNGQGWSGAGYNVSSNFGEMDLTELYANPDDYTFHIGLKSAQANSSYLFMFSDGSVEAKICIGSAAFTDNGVTYEPYADFTRDNEWQSVEIPVTKLNELGVYYNQVFSDKNIFAFLAGGTYGTTLDMDAIFFYRKEK